MLIFGLMRKVINKWLRMRRSNIPVLRSSLG